MGGEWDGQRRGCRRFSNAFALPGLSVASRRVFGGSGDLVSPVISTLIGVISNYKYRYPIYNPSY